MWNIKEELRDYLIDIRGDSEEKVNYAIDLLDTIAPLELEDLLRSLIEEFEQNKKDGST